MAQLNDFVNNMRGGGARANQFSVTFESQTQPNLHGEHFAFMCRSAQIPALTIGEITVPYRGRQIFVPGDRTYDAWTITIYNDTNFSVRDSLERWMNDLQDIGSSTSSGSKQVYYNATVKQKDRNDRTIREYKLVNVWPTTIDAIDLAYDTNDVIEEFGVTFRFNYMTINPRQQVQGLQGRSTEGPFGSSNRSGPPGALTASRAAPWLDPDLAEVFST